MTAKTGSGFYIVDTRISVVDIITTKISYESLTELSQSDNILASYLSSEGTTKNRARIKNSGYFTGACQTLLVGMSYGVHRLVE